MTYEAWRITYQSSEQAARAAYAECVRLRAKIGQMENVESALSALLNDLEERAKWNFEETQRIVACGNGVYMRAKAALERNRNEQE